MVRRVGRWSSGGASGPYLWGSGSGYRSDGDGGGLVQCGARYYDAGTGRFLTRDTELGEHPYAYCGGDPVNFTDPSGHSQKGKKKDPPKPGGTPTVPLGPNTTATVDPNTGVVTITTTATTGSNPSATGTASASSNGNISAGLSGQGATGRSTVSGGVSFSFPGGLSFKGSFGYSTGGFGVTDSFGTGQSNMLMFRYDSSANF